MRSILGSFFQNQASTSGTLLNNIIPNPKGEMKAITTRSGVAYEGPSIPTNPSPKKTLPKPNIPYPSRGNDQKSSDKASNQMEKIFQIFQDLRFDISFEDSLLLMPRFAPMIKSLLMNKEKLLELAKIPLNENFSAMLLKKFPEKLGDPDKFLIPCDFPGMDKKLSLPELTPSRMTLELADRSITPPKGLAEDVFIKVGKFHFPTDFVVVVDFEADPRVPLILGRSFLRTGRALIDVYGEEITLRVNDEAVTFNLDHSMRYSSTYDDMSVNRIDVIDVACEEYSQEVLDYLKDDSISPEIDHADLDPKGDICLIEKLLNKDMFQLPPMDLKQVEVTKAKSSTEEPPKLELKDLPSHLEYAYLEGTDKLPVIIAKSYFQIPIDLQDKEKTTFTCPNGTFAYRRMPFGLCNAPGTFQRPMSHLLEKDAPFVFSQDCIDAFETLKKKLTEAPILVVPDWNLPFELMCDASDFAIGAVLGQRKTKHFQPIHYASKTMTEAQIHYTTTEKEMLVVVYAFEKFRPYLVLSKSIVYTNHSALKYLLSKQDAKLRLLRWVLLLQEFDIIIHDKKGTENLAADHLSRLENPHKDMLENKDINENFSLETLGVISRNSWSYI
ncbi:reverse transcriptase domain-containing protein [Tanacetum coccineum]|uniref:RNA-directed DNA polymerase n=1 Tax=Tanacetum coccineum TaxID=301880 RepID=A0ABQ5B3T6_9ASTR